MVSGLRFPTPVEAALTYVRVYNSHDPVALRSLYAEEFHVENPLWAGSKPVDETVATLQHVWDTLPGARFDLRNVISQGDTVVIEFDFVWDDSRPETLASNGGRPVAQRTPVTDVFHVVDGKLASLRAYMNSDLMHAWLEEMGGALSTA